MRGVEQRSMSLEPLTPTSFLRRSAVVFASRVAVIDGQLRLTYAELWERSRRLAGALEAAGVEAGDRVAVVGSNSQLALLAHYGVPLAKAVLVPLNVRLTAAELAFNLEHSGARLILCDRELEELATAAAGLVPAPAPRVVAEDELEQLLTRAPLVERRPDDERELLSINYTSGTTGSPKGVMYHHRGAYLQSLAIAMHNGLGPRSAFLWIVPMFHCHGWCLTWGVTAAGATHVCQRRVDPGEMWRAIQQLGFTHLAAAPTVLTALADHPSAAPIEPGRETVRVVTGGAPPSPTLLTDLGELGIEVTHAYGLTETFGPIMLCDWNPDWDGLGAAEQARLKARQGVNNLIAEAPRVVDESGADTPRDGETMGELVLRGNDLMLGYYRNEEVSAAAELDGWFRTGDMGVMHPDGYVELRDRSKDVIVSGGENITSVEIEQAIVSHPAVSEVAVVSVPDPRWGERPAAFVTLKDGATATDDEIVAHVRDRLASFKVPRDVHFVAELPKTSTGKIRKYTLREEAWSGHERNIG
jgi:fatty-acyl-CoA synthase